MIIFRWILAALLVLPVGYLCYYLYMRVARYVLGDNNKQVSKRTGK